jgi:hypothetical protein
MGQGLTRFGVVAAMSAVGCADPSLDLPGLQTSAISLTFEPVAQPRAVPAAFRARLERAPSQGSPWLFRGELSDHHDGAVRRGELSAALRERALPLRFWRSEAELWLQPLEWLDVGHHYTLALTGLGRVSDLTVADAGVARATRFFPPADAPKRGSTVLCAPSHEELPSSVTLEPGSVPLAILPGAFGATLAGCFTLLAERPLLQAVVAPPVLGGVLLEPFVFAPPPQPPVDGPPCVVGQPLAGACLEVEDDRVLVTAGGDDALWLLAEPLQSPLSVRAFERATLLRGLAPGSGHRLRGRAISSDGSSMPFDLTVTTQPERRHLIVNEVLANALGPEPESEWIEVVNDSERPADLLGVWLEDGSGRVPLPAARLEPGETALLVGSSFRASGLDVPLPPGARVLELPSLGQRGLSNSGEALLLVGREGVLSRFPMLAASHAGKSMARRRLDAADDSSAGFAEHGGLGASPGAHNVFD